MTRQLLALVFFAGVSLAGPLPIPLVPHGPTIDGDGGEPVWEAVGWQSGFTRLGHPEQPAAVNTRFKAVHDGRCLYVLTEAVEPQPESLRMRSLNRRDDPMLWKDDNIEVHLDPGGTAAGYYQFIVNWKGTVFDARGEDDNRGQDTFALNMEWNADVTAAARVDGGAWHAELRIPFAALDLRPDLSAAGWGLNVCRSRYVGKAAHTTWAPLGGEHGFAQPRNYRKIELVEFDASPFQWLVSRPGVRVTKGEEGLTCEVRTTVGNQTGEFRIAILTAELRAGAGKPVATARETLILKDKEEKDVVLCLPPAVAGRQRLRLTVARRAEPDLVLKRSETPVTLLFQPVRARLLRPAYRNCIFASQKLEQILLEVVVDGEYAGRPLRVDLVRERTTIDSWATPSALKRQEIALPCTELPDGRYVLCAAMGDLDPVEIPLRKLPYLKGEVWLDHLGNTHVDGESFVPFGWFSGPFETAPHLNAVQSYGLWTEPEQILNVLDRAHAAGLKLLLVPFHGEKRWDDPIKNEARRGAFTPAHEARVRYIINAIKHHPGILGWYMADEPEGFGHSVEWYRDAYRLLREIDPHHPCIMLNYGLRGIRTYYEGCDILMPDCYPVFRIDGTTKKPMWALTEWTEAAAALRPTWLVPQAFSWDGTGEPEVPGRAPTLAELRNQIWQVVAAGGKGFLLYSYYSDSRPYAALRLGVPYLGREVAALKAAVLAPPVSDGIEVQVNPADEHFAVSLRRSEDALFVLAINTAREARDVTVRLTDSAAPNRLHVLGEGRSVPLEGGQFTETFAPLATHLYTSDAELARALDLTAVRQAVAALDRSRLKPGNLVGIGPIPRHRIKALAAAAATERPTVTYSSWAMMYCNRKQDWHIYYLFDGLSQDVLHHSWRPRGHDKSPWLEVALPAPTPVGRVRVYTPVYKGQAKLRGFRVLVRLPDGELQAVAEVVGNVEHAVTAVFAPVEAKAVRLELVDFTSTVKGCRETGLVTEVEVYPK